MKNGGLAYLDTGAYFQTALKQVSIDMKLHSEVGSHE
jgi:hypothetical protein